MEASSRSTAPQAPIDMRMQFQCYLNDFPGAAYAPGDIVRLTGGIHTCPGSVITQSDVERALEWIMTWVYDHGGARLIGRGLAVGDVICLIQEGNKRFFAVLPSSFTEVNLVFQDLNQLRTVCGLSVALAPADRCELSA